MRAPSIGIGMGIGLTTRRGPIAPAYDELVEKLTADGGWFWDFTRADKLFQDSAGTTPVAALDDPVGRAIDVITNRPLVQATAANCPLFKVAAGILFDGTNDGLASDATMDLTGTAQAILAYGARKGSDAARGIVAELGAAAGSAGKFIATAPDFAAQQSFGIVLQGSSASCYYQMQPFPAPVKAVVSAKLNLAGANRAACIQSYVNRVRDTSGGGGSNTGLGAGNFGNYTLYVGRRGGTTMPYNGYLTGLVVVPYIDDKVRVLAERTLTLLNKGLP